MTRTLEAVSVGGSLPTVMVWLTNTSTSAWSALADIDAAAGKLATAEISEFEYVINPTGLRPREGKR